MTQNIEQSVQALNIIKIWWLMLNFEIDVMWLITGTDLIHTIKFVKNKKCGTCTEYYERWLNKNSRVYLNWIQDWYEIRHETREDIYY